ncbi:MAG TPA: hypothetical protein DCY93_04075 [Firmicutes bacterium]|nr:hypothetical protein [Bacillota bacterium]
MEENKEEQEQVTMSRKDYKRAQVLYILSWVFFVLAFISMIAFFPMMYFSCVVVFFSVLSFTLAYIANNRYGVVTTLLKTVDVISFIIGIIMFLCFLVLLVMK